MKLDTPALQMKENYSLVILKPSDGLDRTQMEGTVPRKRGKKNPKWLWAQGITVSMNTTFIEIYHLGRQRDSCFGLTKNNIIVSQRIWYKNGLAEHERRNDVIW